MGLHQTKKLSHSKRNHQQNKKSTHGIGEHFANTSDKGLISKFINPNTKQKPQTIQFKKWAKELKKHFSERTYIWPIDI